MEKIKVWTRQHNDVLRQLETKGRYTAKRKYINMDLQEHAPLVLEAYDWLIRNCPDAVNRPKDAEYPVWVSFEEEATIPPGENGVLLELTVDANRVTSINVAKWGAILNYSYIPADEKDRKRHADLLKAYRISDSQACMSQFYPNIRREIMESWSRLFDENIRLGSDYKYGTIWEIRHEWITKIIR